MANREYYTNFFTRGDKIYVRGIVDGKRYKNVVEDWSPTIFQKSNVPTGIFDLEGNHLKPCQVDGIKSARELVNRLEGTNLLRGYQKWDKNWAAETFDPDVVADSWKFEELSIASLDIETTVNGAKVDPIAADEEINIITIRDSRTNTKHVFATGDWKRKNDLPARTFFYGCSDEIDLLDKFLVIWEHIEPDVVTGWNVERFDIVYIVNRITKLLGDKAVKRLSPWGKVALRDSVDDFGNDSMVAEIAGVAIIDLMRAYKKFVLKPRESYRLDHIAFVELKKTKLKHPSGVPGHLLYKTDFSAAIDYNVEDEQLVWDLEGKLDLIKIVLTIAYSSLSNFEDVWSQLRIWTNIIYLHLKSTNRYFAIEDGDKIKKPIIGGFVKSPLIGKKRYVVSFDVTSEYPSLLMALNMSPETLIQGPPVRFDFDMALAKSVFCESEDVHKSIVAANRCVAANGHMFDKSRHGFMAEVTKKMFTERAMFKKKMLASKRLAESGDGQKEKHAGDARKYDLLQNARKVQLNSLYGATANEYFKFYDYRIAEAITTSGRLLIQWVARDVNHLLNALTGVDKDRIIAIDTDSIYVDLEDYVKKMGWDGLPTNEWVDLVDSLCSGEFQNVINDSLKALSNLYNAYEPEALSMKREAISTAGIFTAKKRYALKVIDNEGVRFETPELKSMGLQIVQSRTPEKCKTWMKEIFDVLLEGDERTFKSKIDQYRTLHSSLAPEEMGMTTGVTNVDKYMSGVGGNVVGSTPIGSRAAIIHNWLVDKNGLGEDIPKIESGMKIKLLHLRKGNPTGGNLIGFVGELPKKFKLHDWIDHDTMFQKSFVDAIHPIAVAIGWNTEDRAQFDLF